MIDLAGIGNLLEYLVAADNITCEERDRIILRIAKENDIAEYTLSALAGYGKSKSEVLESVARRKNSVSQDKKQDESYISLTEIARAHSEDAPGYVIQSWLRSGNTLAFLNLWEQENNPDYSEAGYEELLEKKKAASFTLTLKLWIDRTKAIGIVSKQGKAGGTFAHPMIACEFIQSKKSEFVLPKRKSREESQLGLDLKYIISHYGQEIFRGEYQKDLEGFVQILVNSRNRIAHIKSKQNRKFLNGDESVLYLHKLSLMYRIILLDLLDIPLNRYKERLSNRIETINCWWADRCDQ